MTRPALPLRAALARGPLVLDGGLSNQLEAAGQRRDLVGELWTARLLLDDPARIEAAHAAYVRAGARVLITGTYQASFEGFRRAAGVGRREAGALFRRGVSLAREAAGRHEVWVAASVGPYGAVLADGGEYRGRYGLSVGELAAFHRPRIEALAEAEPDVLALETVPEAAEAEAMLRAAEGCGLPVWLSFTADGARTRAGERLEDAFALAAGRDQVVAVGVNCCDPADAGRAVEIASAVTGKPVVVYPNSGEEWLSAGGAPGGGEWRGPGSWSPDLAAGWVERGARLVGGCCRVGPEAVARLAREPSLGGPGKDIRA